MNPKSDYQFFTNTKDAVEAMYEAIVNAKSSIYLETYILRSNNFSYKLIEKLKEKVSAGLEVKIIFDGFGIKDFDENIIEDLKKAGADVIIFNPFNLSTFWRGIHFLFERNHRKVLIIDKEIGFIGGVNISGYNDSWIDLQVKVTGPSVMMLLKSFSHSYLAGGGMLAKIKHLFYLPVIKERYWRILWHQPNSHFFSIKSFYLNWIKKARHSITIASPYFLPDEDLINAMSEAKKRGVKIDLILPWKTDHDSLTHAIRSQYSLYSKIGMKIYLVKKMLHAKSMMVDGKTAFIGSSNFDSQSFYRSHETNLIFSNKKMIADLRKIFKEWRKNSRLFRPLLWAQRSWRAKIREFLWGILRPFL